MSLPAITEKEFELMGRVSDHLIPIAQTVGSGIELIGTGVYVKKGNCPLLITAHHVLDRKPWGEILIPGTGSKLVRVSGIRTQYAGHPVHDVSVTLLKDEIPSLVPVPNLGNGSRVGAEILLAGFPISRSKPYKRSLEYEARFVKTWVLEHAGQFPAFDEKFNLICDFHQEKILLGGGVVGSFPHPWGMSGGAAFELIRSVNGEVEYVLTGIITDWDPKRKQFMRLTKFELVSSVIDEMFAELGIPKR